jgi:hypothetical protein
VAARNDEKKAAQQDVKRAYNQRANFRSQQFLIGLRLPIDLRSDQ